MSEIKLDIDLNELFRLSYDFDNLKSALGQILKAMQLNTKTCNDMKKMVDTQNKDIKKLKEENDEKDAKIKDLTDRVKHLEDTVKTQKEQIKDNKENLDKHTTVLNDHTSRIESLEGITKSLQDRLKSIEDKLIILGDGGMDINAIKDLLDKFKQECDERYANKQAFESLEDRVSILEDQSKEFKEKFKGINEKLDKYGLDILKLFDTKAEKADLQDLLDKLNNLLKEVEEALKWKQPVLQITNRIDKVEIQIQHILKNLGKGEGLDDTLLKALEEKHNQLRDDFEKFKEDVMNWLKNLQDALDGKADETALKELEKYLLNRLEDLANGLDKRFADKNETKKALKALEKQIKNLFDLLMSKGNG